MSMRYENKALQLRRDMEENIPIEIERRFLLISVPPNLGTSAHLRQWYIPSSSIEFNENIIVNGIKLSLEIEDNWNRSVYDSLKKNELMVRIRLDGKTATLCIKTPRKGISRFEYECKLQNYTFVEKMLVDSNWPMVEKQRWKIKADDGHLWELDQFLGLNAGLWLAEIELNDENEDFVVPNWVGLDVTHENRFSSSRLSMTSYNEFKEDYEGY